jgi:hypothetical protein
MPPEGWGDIDGVHYGPEDGVKSSYSRRDMAKEVIELADLAHRDYLVTHGCFTRKQMRQLLTTLIGSEAENIDDEDLSQRVAEEAGVPHQTYQGSYHCFTEDSLWEILQTVKSSGETTG